MKKLSRIILFFIVLAMTVSVMPLKALAVEPSSKYLTVTKNKSYTKDGRFYLSFTFKNVSNKAKIKISAQLLNPSGKVLSSYGGFEFGAGKTQNWAFGYNYSSLPSGTYTLRVRAADWNYAYGELQSWTWSYSIKHTAPTPSFSFKSYETFYNDYGYLAHKINIQCTNMKGKKLYCKIYNSEGYLVHDFGTDTPARKTNNEVGYFYWTGYHNGEKYPSGEYTFVVTSNANKKVIEKTLNLKILEVAKK